MGPRTLLVVDTASRRPGSSALETIVAKLDGTLGIGRKSRSIPRWLERRVRRRDHGCRYPGCGLSRWTQIHHMRHWKAGDRAGTLEFVSSHGRVLTAGPPALRPEILAA